jgi:Uncharacterized protein involved in tellurite resistance
MTEEKITLTLNSEEEQVAETTELTTAEETKQITPLYITEDGLSDEEKKQIDDFANQIDLTQSNLILQYGAAAQKKIATFSEATLSNVKTKDLGEIGNTLTDLVVELKGFSTDAEEEKGLAGLFKKTGNKLLSFKARYDKAEINVNKIVEALESHQIQLMKDIAMLDEMYDKNLINFKELTMYILAGRKKVKKVREEELPNLVKKAQESGLAEDSQKANDLAQLCDRFEKKLYDLELTRNISLQMGPQIRLVQNNDTLMTEKIQSTLVNTIPLWKSQMVLALGINHSKQAVEAQQAVNKVTNELLKKNAKTLKQATIDTAKESEKGIVDIETLKITNQHLITTLDEVVKIQTEGRVKRAAAEEELARIEGELKQKLLDIRA